MKESKTSMDKWFDKMDERWMALPIGKQHRYALCFFIAYLLLTVAVIYRVSCDIGTSANGMVISPIENPVLKNKESPARMLDTVQTIQKNKIYERK